MAEPFEERRRARAHWPVRKFRLGEPSAGEREGCASRAGKEPRGDVAGTTVEERVDMVWQLTLDAWASAGWPIPSYPRSEMPVRVLRKGEAADAK